METYVIWYAIIAFIGAISTGLLGYMDSGNKFEFKKFAATVIRALIAAVGIAAIADYSNQSDPTFYLMAFLAGAGVDVALNRAAGALKKG